MENANTNVNNYLLQKYLLKEQRKETYLTYIKNRISTDKHTHRHT